MPTAFEGEQTECPFIDTSLSFTFGKLAAHVMTVGINSKTTPTENVKSFLKLLN